MRSILCDILSRAGYETSSAADGCECLDILGREKTDICTLDLNMPGLNGFDVLARIKTNRPEIKTVIISAQSSAENVLKARELGAAHFIAKPFTCNELLKVLESL